MKRLHKKRKKYFNQAVEKFRKSNPTASEATINELKNLLEIEADRIYDIVDNSLLIAGIKRANWTFWITAMVTLVTVATLTILSAGVLFPTLILPVVAASIVWFVTISTIPFSYNGRVKGGLDAVINAYEKALSAKIDIDKELASNESTFNRLSVVLAEIIKKYHPEILNKDDIGIHAFMERQLIDMLNRNQNQPEIIEAISLLTKNLYFPFLNQNEISELNEIILTEHQSQNVKLSEKNTTVSTVIILQKLNDKIDMLDRKIDENRKLIDQIKFQNMQSHDHVRANISIPESTGINEVDNRKRINNLRK